MRNTSGAIMIAGYTGAPQCSGSAATQFIPQSVGKIPFRMKRWKDEFGQSQGVHITVFDQIVMDVIDVPR